MAETGSVSKFYHKGYQNGSEYLEWKEDVRTNAIAGYINGDNYVSVFRFDLPKSIKQFTFSFCLLASNTTNNPVIRYKVISGAEDPSLANANSNIVGDGTFTIPDRADWTRVTVTIDKFVPSGTTYLYLWTDKADGIGNAIGIQMYKPSDTYGTTGTYIIGGGVIYIDNGSGFDTYEIWIDNGSTWEQYQAYIDNGSGWDECG